MRCDDILLFQSRILGKERTPTQDHLSQGQELNDFEVHTAEVDHC